MASCKLTPELAFNDKAKWQIQVEESTGKLADIYFIINGYDSGTSYTHSLSRCTPRQVIKAVQEAIKRKKHGIS